MTNNTETLAQKAERLADALEFTLLGHSISPNDCHSAAATLRTFTAALAKVEAALKPFAEADDLEDAQDCWNIWEHPAAMNITIGNLRAAKAALISIPKAPKE